MGGRDSRRPAGPVAIATIGTAMVSGTAGLVIGDLDLTPGLPSLAWLALLGVTSQSIGYLCISLALPRLPAVVTSIILLVQPPLTVLLSVVLLDERPSAAQLAGVALVIGGIAVATIPLARWRDGLRSRDETVRAVE
jgi:drug/metabolite transporter (DMT)-like permease